MKTRENQAPRTSSPAGTHCQATSLKVHHLSRISSTLSHQKLTHCSSSAVFLSRTTPERVLSEALHQLAETPRCIFVTRNLNLQLILKSLRDRFDWLPLGVTASCSYTPLKSISSVAAPDPSSRPSCAPSPSPPRKPIAELEKTWTSAHGD